PWKNRSRRSRKAFAWPAPGRPSWRKRSARSSCCWRTTASLPLAPMTDRAGRSGDVVARPSEGMAARKKIIIVDDDRETREMLKMALELEGYEVTQAANGLRLISSLHVDRPDLILLDVNMSWIDGFELCRAVRKNGDFKDIPVIFVSARTTASDVKRGRECGAADYFTKPVDMPVLVAR